MKRIASVAVVAAIATCGATPALAAPPTPPPTVTSFQVPACGGVVTVVELINNERSRTRDGVTTYRGHYVLQVTLVGGRTVTLNVSGPTQYDASNTFTGTGSSILFAPTPTARAAFAAAGYASDLLVTTGRVSVSADGAVISLPNHVVDVCALLG